MFQLFLGSSKGDVEIYRNKVKFWKARKYQNRIKFINKYMKLKIFDKNKKIGSFIEQPIPVRRTNQPEDIMAILIVVPMFAVFMGVQYAIEQHRKNRQQAPAQVAFTALSKA